MTGPAAIADAPFRPIAFIDKSVEVTEGAGGVLYLRNRLPMPALDDHIPALFRQAAAAHPDRTWLAERRGPDDGWQRLSYAAARAEVDAVTQWLLDLGRPGAPVMILSDNALESGVLMLAAMQARMPVTAISSAYSLKVREYSKMSAMVELLQPAVLFVQDGARFAPALAGIGDHGARVLAVSGPCDATWSEAATTPVTEAVDASVRAISHDTVAKYLFTSGSTGQPKAVITTQRMLCVNLAMTGALIAEDPATHQIVVEWLPWSHVMAGSFIFDLILKQQGSYYIDGGRPMPGLYDATLRNLAEVMPTQYRNVPLGYALLADALERDEALARRFFAANRYLAYAGAAIPAEVHDRIQALSIRHTGARTPFVSGYGATESSPSAFFVFWASERVGLIGLPEPGCTAKLVPLEDGRFEVRVKHAGITPGYFGNPEATAALFDEEGFLVMGDAAEFIDPARPEEGMVFAGRVSEEFKLTSGTFVRVGALRTQILSALAPLALDVVLTGADRAFVGAMVWLNLAQARAFLDQPEAGTEEMARDPRLVAAITAALGRHNAANPGTSRRVARVVILPDAPSLETGEMTDKGYVNQRRAQQQRADIVAALHADAPPDTVHVIPD